MIIINQGRVNYCYKTGEYEPVIRNTVMSNSVNTFIIDSNLSVEKKVDKVTAFIYDILTYTINIWNISSKKVENITLKDCIPYKTKFINDSLKINNEIVQGVFPNSVKVGSLSIKEKVQVSFQVIIEKSNTERDKIINCAQVYYDFIVNIEKPPITVRILTNKVVTCLNSNIISCISKASNLIIALNNLEDIKVRWINYEFNIIKSKIVNTVTGKKLFLIIKCNYLICYYKCVFNYDYELCTENYVDYFSYLIDIQQDSELNNVSSLNLIEENCCFYYIKDESRLVVCNSIIIVNANKS